MANDPDSSRLTRPAKTYRSEIPFEAVLFGNITPESFDISSGRGYLLVSPAPVREQTTLVRVTCGALANTHSPQNQYQNAAAITSNSGLRFVNLSDIHCAVVGLTTVISSGLEQEMIGTVKEVVEKSANDFLQASGRAKKIARTQFINLLRSHESRIEGLRAAIEQISSAKSAGHLGDAVDVLTELRELVKDLAEASLRESPPNGANDDYWYVLIRGFGKTGNADILRQFVSSPYRSLREAVAEAFHDLKDQGSLSQIASEDKSPFIREIAQELLDDLKEVSSNA